LGGQISTQALPGSLHLTKLELVVNRKAVKALALKPVGGGLCKMTPRIAAGLDCFAAHAMTTVRAVVAVL
jgi:hypothetical protein